MMDSEALLEKFGIDRVPLAGYEHKHDVAFDTSHDNLGVSALDRLCIPSGPFYYYLSGHPKTALALTPFSY